VKSQEIARSSISLQKYALKLHLSTLPQPTAALLPSKVTISLSLEEFTTKALIKIAKLSKCIPSDILGIQLKVIDG
jgi:hypothetical protein